MLLPIDVLYELLLWRAPNNLDVLGVKVTDNLDNHELGTSETQLVSLGHIAVVDPEDISGNWFSIGAWT